MYLFLFVSTISAQAPIGVCLSNVAQTISNGVIAPIPYASVALCSSGSTAANCVANKVSIYTSAALSTATPTNPFTSDAGGNYFFCAAAGDYALLINSSYGQYFVPDIELVDDWSKGGTMTGALTDAAGFIGPLTGNASTASALAATPSACNPSSYFAYGIAANGNALCNALPAGETLYYQTVQTAGTALPQQPIVNFDATMSAANGSGKTNVGLPTVANPGAYAYPASITIDAQGRTSSIVSGTVSNGWSGNGSSCALSTGCWVKDPVGHIHQWGTKASCATGDTIYFATSFYNGSTVVVHPTSLWNGSSGISFVSVTNGSINASAFQIAAGVTTGQACSWDADGY